MDVFTLIVIAGIVLLVLVFLAIGAWHPARALEITDSDRQQRWATQAEIEEREVGEMVEGQNAYRRARGDSEITVRDAQRAAAERQRESIARTRGE
ncbi:MAG: hypothetical protein QOI10_2816 [Solirubrobacterales bacterium]|jgi:hypothetical protein|nr:hypothetical protein [Solirubrobacterales bacterium]